MKRDLQIYNEATGWTLHSASFMGHDRQKVADDLPWAVGDGLILPLSLVQDDPIYVRVTTNPLTPAEDAEWVARAVGRLRIGDGKLVLEGGFDARAGDEFRREVDVPIGDYRVEIYTLFWGINGEYCLPAGEPLGTWFRRTREGKRFPPLLQLHLADNPEEDPGFEAKWDRLAESDRYDELEAPDQLDFIVRLTPWIDGEAVTPPKEDGWLPIDATPRRPEACPLGLAFKGA
ncbi:MAG: hypothetical protein ACO1SV_06915 [Fimbriimonas sp.]